MRPLPRSLDPLDDETLTGFVVRLAHRVGATPAEIISRTGLSLGRPGPVARLPLGLLYHLDAARLTAFARTTHLAVDEVTALLLAPLGERYGPLNTTFTPRRSPSRMVYDNPWVLARSTRYCPPCLAGDGAAIQDLHGGGWKRSWRLPVVFFCLRHQHFLLHECPGCDAPSRFSRRTAVSAIARLPDGTLHPWQCRHAAPSTSGLPSEAACGTDLRRAALLTPELDKATMARLVRLQEKLTELLDRHGPETVHSAGTPVPVAHYFADLRAMVAMVFRSWPVTRPYAGTPCLAAALDAEHAGRAAAAQPLLDTQGKKKTSRPYTTPPLSALATGAALDVAVNLLDSHSAAEARDRLVPLVRRLREADLALSTWLRRPAWISAPLRRAVQD